MAQNGKILQLQALIARHRSTPPPRPAAVLESGVSALDGLLGGGLPKGAMVEVVSPGPSRGASSLLLALLAQGARQRRWSALIDAADRFDPQSAGAGTLSGLLWMRCRAASEAMRCADLLLRDGNLPLVVLDLRGAAAAELRRIPDPHWYRLQRALEPVASTLLVVSAQPLVPCAQARLLLEGCLGWEALGHGLEGVVEALHLELVRRRAGGAHGPGDLAHAG